MSAQQFLVSPNVGKHNCILPDLVMGVQHCSHQSSSRPGVAANEDERMDLAVVFFYRQRRTNVRKSRNS